MHTARNFLLRNPLFLTLSEKAGKRIADSCQSHCYQRGEIIFEERKPAERVWVVQEGWVYLTRKSPQGNPVTIFAMTPDETLCGVSAFDHGTYSATAVAATDTQLVSIPASIFSEILDDNPAFAKEVLSICCQRIRHMAEFISLAQAPVRQRVAYTLLRLRSTFGNTLPIIHQELACMAGTRIETSIRIVSWLKKRGYLSTSRGRMVILQADKLKALTNGTSSH
ncbi:MAG: Crp/Fnr family transcriptional regulator [Candidatus Omnitrophica bacterium]|nr:Crp/Fnr family transcriptional regulator [Candidatus Omnitrophota bacterium]